MPRFMADEDTQVIDIPGPGTFKFSAQRPEDLGASEYTLSHIALDVTGSVASFAQLLRDLEITIVKSCQLNQRRDNLLLRNIHFNTQIDEIHGFIEVMKIKPEDYDEIRPTGMTALYDATYSSVASILQYAETLGNQDFDVNGALFIVTDGLDNRSKISKSMIAEQFRKAKQDEQLESLISVLIGVFNPNDPDRKYISAELEKFKNEAGIDQYVDAGEATPEKLAKIANFISESISSQSQSLGKGSASQPLAF